MPPAPPLRRVTAPRCCRLGLRIPDVSTRLLGPGQCLHHTPLKRFSLKLQMIQFSQCGSSSRRFQAGEGPSRGLLRDYENRWFVCKKVFICPRSECTLYPIMYSEPRWRLSCVSPDRLFCRPIAEHQSG